MNSNIDRLLAELRTANENCADARATKRAADEQYEQAVEQATDIQFELNDAISEVTTADADRCGPFATS